MAAPVNPSPAEQALSNLVISHLRTLVPILWGFIASWLIGLGIPSQLLDQAHGVVQAALTALLAYAWYALWCWLEPRLPKQLVRLALGYAATPNYPTDAGQPRRDR
jgi:hypothetical protein